MKKCNHGHEVQKCNVCRDRFEVRIVEEGKSIKQTCLQMTHNGFHWQSIACKNEKELRALSDALVGHLFQLDIKRPKS